MLVAKNISYKIGNKTLLDQVSVSFHPGKLNLVLGPNGAGKSTLIKALGSHHKAIQGEVVYGDRNLRDMTVHELAKMRAVLSQNIDLAFPMLVEDVVMMGRYPHFSGRPTTKDYEAANASIELFDLRDLCGRDYMTLSGGEKQRVHFARVLAQIWYPVKNSSRYLLLDEPLTYLDIFYQYQFMNKIKSLMTTEDLLVVGVLHDLNLTAKFADHIVLMQEGRVLAQGDKKQVLTKEYIKQAYKMDAVVQQSDDELRLFL